jgi:hypothetical protein
MLAKKAELALATRAPRRPTERPRIGPRNDTFEQEADRFADSVTRGATGGPPWSFSGMQIETPLQRKCACGDTATPQEHTAERQLQGRATGVSADGKAPPIVHEVLAAPGRPLDSATRRFFQPRLEAIEAWIRQQPKQ